MPFQSPLTPVLRVAPCDHEPGWVVRSPGFSRCPRGSLKGGLQTQGSWKGLLRPERYG
jgi:hypothetical protein